ncbi:M56 family metallopeptidase [Saccharibacillus sp. JS10]|uniref:M56 family metallopeptidase n=1 Tax=Saccharibacillus sp. JS10 TaxID=2950552 RepID=UPI00210A2AD4|nr:M56 family metallopeptidase [Saccharibacillus sp. JS10]MCQ4087461.1 hypothetical protein [Saccharibacillus sp. JS10]
MLTILLQVLLALTVAGSVVTVSLLGLRWVPDEQLSATWRYRLGKMALLLYLLPIAPLALLLLKSQWTSGSVQPSSGLTASPMGSDVNNVATLHTGLFQPSFVLSANIATVIIGIWITGSLIYAIWQINVYQKASRLLNRTSELIPPDEEVHDLLQALTQELNIRKKPQLMRNPLLQSPVLAGLRTSTIYLPANLTEEIDMALRHELTHLRSRDLLIKLLTLVAVSLHWFNPLVYQMRRELHLWSELSCDASVVANMDHAQRKRYGKALIVAAAGTDPVRGGLFAPLSGDGKQLKRRLSHMLTITKFKKKTIILASAAAVALATLSTTAAVWAAESTPPVAAPEPVTVPAQSLGIAPTDSDDVVAPSPTDPAQRSSTSQVTVPVQVWEASADQQNSVSDKAVPIPAESVTSPVTAPTDENSSLKAVVPSEVATEPAPSVDSPTEPSAQPEVTPIAEAPAASTVPAK